MAIVIILSIATFISTLLGGLFAEAHLSFIGNEDTLRLACCVKVLGDIEVETAPELNLFGENFFS